MVRQRWLFFIILAVGLLVLAIAASLDTPVSEAKIQPEWGQEALPSPTPVKRKANESPPKTSNGMAASWTPVVVADDPLVRMPGTQPDQDAEIIGPDQCVNCHADYDPLTEPVENWQGSMMAQAGRDFLYWATLTVAGQDAIWAVGNPNATDICLRCHMTGGWLAGRSDPTNGSLMTGIDFDGVQCNLCHYLYDPFYESTFDGSREGNDWSGYWDETNASNTPSNAAALATYNQDSAMAQAITLFNGQPFFTNDQPPAAYDENGGGQLFFSTLSDDRRASFADASATHTIVYSRYHKSKYFCNVCHDISNPVLHNLGADPTQPLPSEEDAVYSYYHVERTFSEFMLSDFGQQGGAAGLGPYAPEVFDTSQPGNVIASCQDCHMPDVEGKGCDKNRGLYRPDDSSEHPNSAVPQHDLTGGNMWVSAVLASAVSSSANYDATNDALLNLGPDALTLDLTAGDVFDADALLAGVGRAQQMLLDAAAIDDVSYDPGSGELTFEVQNQTGHKLISGYPEGRRMFLNLRYYDGDTLLMEVNPYDNSAGTLKGLSGYIYDDPDDILPQPATLDANETYVDELVYEMHGSSSLTGEDESFHFALGTHRYKDNRIPPMGFRIDEAAGRLSEPVWHGSSDLEYFSDDEYDGGYDDVDLADLGLTVPGANRVEIKLYYQTTSREYIEFLRNEINGTGALTLSGTGAGGDPPYIIQSDPFFNQLKAWGDTIWQLWRHNKDLPGAAPVEMSSITYHSSEVQPPVPLLPSGVISNNTPTYSWQEVATATDYQIYLTDADGQFVYSEWVSAAAVCSAGTCSHTPAPVLDQADYNWNVRADNSAGTGPWSPALAFTVFTGSAAPGAATLLAPNTTIADTTPTYSWQEVTDAIRYRVYLLDGDRLFAHGTTIQARNACSAGTCVYTMPTPLPDGDYRYFIRSENPLGGTWSAPMKFTVFTGSSAPGPATLVAPNGVTGDATLTYEWNEVPQAIKYKVYLIDDDRLFVYGTIAQAQNACSAGTCSYTMPTPLPDGDYRYFIRAENPLGGTWSAPMLFTLFTGSAAPGQATPVAPNGAISDSTPTYDWSATSEAIQYQVYLLDGSSQFYYGVFVQARNACSGANCSLTPSIVLPDDDYRWYVQALNPLGMTWSAPMDFTLVP